MAGVSVLATLGASVVLELSASGAVNDGRSMLVAVAVPMIGDGMDVSRVVAVAVPIIALGMEVSRVVAVAVPMMGDGRDVSVGRAKKDEDDEEMNPADEEEMKAADEEEEEKKAEEDDENDGVVELLWTPRDDGAVNAGRERVLDEEEEMTIQ